MDLALASKKILTIDLDRHTYEVRNHTDLHKYIGGIGLGLKLYQIHEERDPLIFAVGPLNGFFPFASKTAIILNDSGTVEDLYIGGSLSLRIRFTDIDAIVLLGKSKEQTILNISNTALEFKKADEDIYTFGLPGKRSVINFTEPKVFLDHEFTTHEYMLEEKLKQKNLSGMVVTGTETAVPIEFDKYKELYASILKRTNEITVEESNKPSCSNCPMGCEKSRYGEIGGNVFVHSLVACQYAERIYSDINTTFACLNSIGYTYTHEDLENLPNLVEETLKLIG
jgi:aldehyde:ferredoxin oxidoreductase